MDIFFTADTHFDHERILVHARRPFSSVDEMNQALIEKWNGVVGSRDLVYIVGDFAWTRHGYFQSALNGRKILIRGDHDKMNQKYLANFSEVYDLKRLSIENHPVFLCHWPMRSWPGSARGSWHFYGHSHGTSSEYEDTWSCDVGVDVWNYQPVPWEVLKAKMSAKREKSLRTAKEMEQAREESRRKNYEWLRKE